MGSMIRRRSLSRNDVPTVKRSRRARRSRHTSLFPSAAPAARTVAELLEQLFAQSWDSGLDRFRSPYAFRGSATADDDLSTGLFALAGGSDLKTVELALLRNFRKY